MRRVLYRLSRRALSVLLLLILLAVIVGQMLPEGGILVYSAGSLTTDFRAQRRLYAYDIRQHVRVPLTAVRQVSGDASFSPDGQYIAFASDRCNPTGTGHCLYLMSSTARYVGRIAAGVAGYPVGGKRLIWSPDQTQLVFIGASSRAPSVPLIYQARRGGDRLRTLTTFSPMDYSIGLSWASPAMLTALVGSRDTFIAYQLDVEATENMPEVVQEWQIGRANFAQFVRDSWQGTFLTLVRSEHNGNFDVYALETLSGAAINLTRTPNLDEMDAVFSKDGAWVALVVVRGRQSALVITRRDGSDRRVLVPPTSEVLASPSWSDDGRRILYRFGGVSGERACVVAVDGGSPSCPLAWQPDMIWWPSR